MIDMNDLAYKMRNVAHAQKMNGANIDTDTFMMLRHCAKKVVEAQTAFDQFKFTKEILNLNDSHIKECEKLYKDFISEIADIIACVLIVCANEPTINIEKAMQDCLEKNLAKTKKIDGIDNYEKFTFGSN